MTPSRAELFAVLLLASTIGGCGYTVLKELDERDETAEARMNRQALEARRRYDALSYDERKLDAGLYYLLQLSEQADTSERAKAEYDRLISIMGDETGRIKVSVTLGGTSAIDRVAEELTSFGIEILHKGNTSPFILCLVQPQSLRSMISIASVERIHVFEPGYSN